MKKRWIYLPMAGLLFSVLVIAVSVFAIGQKKWDGRIELIDVQGERNALHDFVLQGTVGDDKHKISFRLEDGVVTPTSFAMESGVPTFYYDDFPVGKWEGYDLEIWGDSVEIFPAPDSSIQTSEEIDESLLEDQWINERYYDDMGRLHGTTTTFEKGQIQISLDYCCLENEKKYDSTRNTLKRWNYTFPTNLIYTPEKAMELVQLQSEEEEYDYEIRNYTNTGIRTLSAWSDRKEMYYITLSTNGDCSGSVGLYCVGPEKGEIGKKYQLEKHDAPYATLAEIPVSKDRRILGLEDVGDGLLLILGEGDGVTMELYDYGGTLLDSYHTVTEERVDEIEVQQTIWDDGRGFYFEGSQQVEKDHYYVHYYEGIWVADGTITPVGTPQSFVGELVAVGKDKVLTAEKGKRIDDFVYVNLDKDLAYYTIAVYDVTEDGKNECVYEGRLETDVDQDRLTGLSGCMTAESEKIAASQDVYYEDANIRSVWLLEVYGKGA